MYTFEEITTRLKTLTSRCAARIAELGEALTASDSKQAFELLGEIEELESYDTTLVDVGDALNARRVSLASLPDVVGLKKELGELRTRLAYLNDFGSRLGQFMRHAKILFENA